MSIILIEYEKILLVHKDQILLNQQLDCILNVLLIRILVSRYDISLARAIIEVTKEFLTVYI